MPVHSIIFFFFFFNVHNCHICLIYFVCAHDHRLVIYFPACFSLFIAYYYLLFILVLCFAFFFLTCNCHPDQTTPTVNTFNNASDFILT